MKLSLAFGLILTFSFYTENIIAQLSNYDLSQYARPELIRSTKVLDGGFSFFNTQSKTGDENIETNVDSRLGGELDISEFRNDSLTQLTSFVSYSGYMGYEYNEDGPISNLFETGASYFHGTSNKSFVNYNQRFNEGDLNLNLSLNYANRKHIDSLIRNDKTTVFADVSYGLYWGRGRVEWVNDAWHAVTILEELQKKSLLDTTEFTHADIDNFAYEIGRIKNTRNTDFRLERISEMEALFAYFKNNELSDLENAIFIAELWDLWIFESFTSRRSGTELKYGIVPGIRIDNIFNSFFTEDLVWRLQPSISLEMEFNRYKPISQDWQFRNENALFCQLSHSLDLNTPENLAFDNTTLISPGFISNWQYSYLPNARTNFSFGGDLLFNYTKKLDDEFELSPDLDHFWNLDLGFSGSFNYYLSPQLVWGIRGSFSLDIVDYSEEYFIQDNFNNRNSISAGFNYYLY